MKIPFFLAEHGYQPDPQNPMRFVHPDGHPFHPVTLTHERQHHHGECIRAMIQAGWEAGKRAGIAGMIAAGKASFYGDGVSPTEILEIKTPPGVRYVDEQCDGCRWKITRDEEARMETIKSHPLHCIMHRERVENCPQQEISHPKKPCKTLPS